MASKNNLAHHFSRLDLADLDRLRTMSTWKEATEEVLGWLVGRSARRQRLADAVLTALGPRVVPDLTRFLLCAGAYPEFQMSLLRILAQIGGRPSAELGRWLMGASLAGPPGVRDYAAAVGAILWASPTDRSFPVPDAPRSGVPGQPGQASPEPVDRSVADQPTAQQLSRRACRDSELDSKDVF